MNEVAQLQTSTDLAGQNDPIVRCLPRYVKDYTLDGWPILDAEAGGYYRTKEDVLILLNKQDREISGMKEMLLALDTLVSACEMPGDHCEIEQALPRAIAALNRFKDT